MTKFLLEVNWLVVFIVVEVITCVAYRLLVWGNLEQTSALFIGLPALLAVLLAVSGPAKTQMGFVMKGTTLFLLLSGPLLGEGFICILMASPIFNAIATLIGWFMCNDKKRYACALPVFLLALEGTTDRLSFPRENTVHGERTIALTSAEFAQRLVKMPALSHDALPFYLRLGFPRPMRAFGDGLQPGSLRGIHFAGGEGKPGDLLFTVEEAEHDSHGGHVRFRFVSDASHISHWLIWRHTELLWTRVDDQHIRVQWTIAYRRLLDPAIYFHPWERYAVSLAGDYCLQELTR